MPTSTASPSCGGSRRVREREAEGWPMTHRTCRRCRQSLQIVAFPVRRDRRRTGERLFPFCRECRNKQAQENYRAARIRSGARMYECRRCSEIGHNTRTCERTGVVRADWLDRSEPEWKSKRESERKFKRKAVTEADQLRILESPVLRCKQCLESKAKTEFHASQIRRIRRGDAQCKSCTSNADTDKFRAGRELLSDDYVKRQISKHTSIRRRDIPQSMIEAKRAQLMIQRIVKPQPTGPQRKTRKGNAA